MLPVETHLVSNIYVFFPLRIIPGPSRKWTFLIGLSRFAPKQAEEFSNLKRTQKAAY